jgi:hypothetical protein
MGFMGVPTESGIARTVESKIAGIESLGCIVGCCPGTMKVEELK